MEYTIGDIVKVIDYGSRVANQEFVFINNKSRFGLTSETPLNIDDIINVTPFKICNSKYANVEWKIVDSTIVYGQILLRLRNRNKGEMLFIYDKRDANLRLVRKARKESFFIG
jgi:hypothetical protein